MTTPYKKKLIEVAIPLEAINAASAREKSREKAWERIGHPIPAGGPAMPTLL